MNAVPVPEQGDASGRRRRVTGARCISLTAAGRPCWRRVAAAGRRCGRCWADLAASPTVAHRVELAAEGDLPPWTAAILAADPEPMVRIVLAGRVDVEPDVLRSLAADTDPGVRGTIAGNPTSPPEVDAFLAADSDVDVAITLATRSTAPVTVLERLLAHPDRRVRGAVAGNPATDEHLERQLACRETEPSVLGALAAKATTAPEVLGWLAQHPVKLVSQPALRRLGLPPR